MASTTSGAPRLSPLVATSTGSSTTGQAGTGGEARATARTMSPVASMPIFTASTRTSAKIASSWPSGTPAAARGRR